MCFPHEKHPLIEDFRFATFDIDDWMVSSKKLGNGTFLPTELAI
jgi:hypothetical protein